jgi:signal transduction histidine kinase
MNESYQALQAGLDLIDQGFTLIDENLCMVAWNLPFLRLLDFPQGMTEVGTPFENYIRYNAERGEYGGGSAGDREQQIQERVAAARAFTAHDIERKRPNGTVLRVRGFPVPGHGFVTLYSDVTAQRLAEQQIREHNALLESRVAERTLELHRSEQQMRLITDSIPALVAYFDHHRSYRYINRGYRDWFGLDPAQPQAISARAYLGADTYLRIKPHVMRALRGEAVTFEYEVRTVDGRDLVARTSLIPELADNGHVAGCFELTFDITEQSRAHERMVQAQKMEAVGQLSSGLAHDFNNILTVILGNLTALEDDPLSRPETANNYIHPAIEAARRGSELIKGLLSFSRKHPLETCTVDLNPQLEAMDKLVRRALPATVAMHINVALQPLYAQLDPHQLQNALLNLILNARDAIETRGTITLGCHCAVLDATRAAFLNLPQGNYACIQVKDDGCGMDAVTRARIFEPFFTTKTPGRGTGLGLAMVYGFVRQTCGAVVVTSEPGLGTQITLWLPTLTQASVTPLPATPANALPPEATQNLALLVEDDPSVRHLVRRLLLDVGYAVIEAETGTEALQILDQTPGIQLLLSDIVMPGGVDGRQVARHALTMGGIPQIVLMSGYAPDGDLMPNVPLLSKPFTKAQLTAALTATLTP